MQEFHITRFGQTLLSQLLRQRRLCAVRAAVPIVVTLVPCLWLLLGRITLAVGQGGTGYLGVLATLFDAALVVYLLTFGALIVDDLGTRKRRTQAFLLPASRLEKFASRYVFLLVVPVAAFLVGCVVADGVQALLFQLFTGDCDSLLRQMFGSEPGVRLMDASDASDLIAAFCALWLIHSLFLLLGTVFRRHAWIKSGVVLVALAVTLALVVSQCVMGVLNLIYGEDNYNIVIIDGAWPAYVSAAVCLALTAFNYWASFRLYSRIQADANRWYNF